MTLFGLFLVYAGIKSWSAGDDDDEEDYNDTRGAKLIRKFFNVSAKYDGDKFFTIVDNVKVATPLLLCLVCVELSDLVFAIDSIPAVLGVSHDSLIVYSSNIFAIMGLRYHHYLYNNYHYHYHYHYYYKDLYIH